ncbi:MAG: ATPase domain-containing protein, partial [Candidatus Magasanikbacteria bacterium]
MTKTQKMFVCSNCDTQYSKWTGRCLECGKWDTLEESILDKRQEEKKNTPLPEAKTLSLQDINLEQTKRIQTSIEELNRVLGGGLVPGSYILLGGEPGIGKSTLSLQFGASVENTLYISGEESVAQIKMRAERILANKNINIQFANTTQVETIIGTIQKNKPSLAIIDSIQTIYSTEMDTEPGNS